MKKKAQVLIIFVWIMVALTILTVSISQRACATFKFMRFHKDRQAALYLARAGAYRAIAELKLDTNSYDSLQETWADSQDIFEKITLGENILGLAAVSHIEKVGGGEKTIFGLVDEESKININKASQNLLTELLKDFNIEPAQQIARNILIWRGHIIDENAYVELGYPPKKKYFTNTEELTLVKGISEADYQELKKFITVYTTGQINVNTVSDRILKILARGLVPGQEGIAESIAEKIIILRDGGVGYFTAIDQIDIPLIGDELNILNSLKQALSVRSDNFSIEAAGKDGRIEHKVKMVYNRMNKKFSYWHEN